MTEQEAKEILTLNDEMQRKLPILKEVYKVAVKALEKQIPKKPRFDHMLNDRNGKFQCGCGYWVTHDCYETNDIPYCSNCGQKFDWENPRS